MENLKISVVENKPCSVTLNIEVPQAEVKTEAEKVYQEIQGKAQVPGFRQGKAPMEMIKRNFVANASEKVAQNLVQRAMSSAFKSHSIDPIDYPSIKDVSFDLEKPLVFKVTAQKHPEVKAKNYKGIKIKQEIRKVDDSKVNGVLEDMRQRNARLAESKSEVVGDSHLVMTDYEGFYSDKPIKDLKAKNQLIDLSAGQMLEGFKEGLIGAKKNEERQIKVKLSADYPNKEISGKDVIFKAVVREIKEKNLPALDDEFAKDFNLKSLEELKGEIRKSLETEESNRQEQDVRKQIVEHLLEVNKFEVPGVLVEEQLKSTQEKTSNYFKQQGQPEESIKKHFEQFKDKYQQEAERTVRVSYLLSSIAKDEKVEVTKDEMDKEYDKLKSSNQGKEAEVEKYFKENKENIEAHLKEDKIFGLMKDQAKIKEKVVK